jgi:pimeloyl-ACP methyl ester carboxylesterase
MPTASAYYYFSHETKKISRIPVIFIHGAGGTHLSWPPQVRRLPDQNIFALDLPGHGKSEGMGRQSIEEYVEDVAAFMTAIKVRAAVIVGHSMGSAIALTFALKYPKRVRGLGLVGSGSRLRVAPAILEGVKDADIFPATVQMINEYSFSSHTSPRLIELAMQRMAETRPSVIYGDFLACDAFNAADQLGQIETPTLILCGREDKMTPLKYSESLRDGITNSQLEVIDGAGHMVMLEQPDAVAENLSRFLNNLRRRAGQRPDPVST